MWFYNFLFLSVLQRKFRTKNYKEGLIRPKIYSCHQIHVDTIVISVTINKIPVGYFFVLGQQPSLLGAQVEEKQFKEKQLSSKLLILPSQPYLRNGRPLIAIPHFYSMTYHLTHITYTLFFEIIKNSYGSSMLNRKKSHSSAVL